MVLVDTKKPIGTAGHYLYTTEATFITVINKYYISTKKSLPQTFQNHSKNLPKQSKNPSKILPNTFQKTFQNKPKRPNKKNPAKNPGQKPGPKSYIAKFKNLAKMSGEKEIHKHKHF